MRAVICGFSLSFLMFGQVNAGLIEHALNDAAKYNLITKEGVDLSVADSQGIIAVGGDAIINGYDVGTICNDACTLGNGKPALQVDGNLRATGDQIIKGDAIVKGTYSNKSSSEWHHPIPTWRNLSTTGGIDIAETFNQLIDFSEALGELSNNTTSVINESKLTVTADVGNGYNGNLFVSDIDLTSLNGITGIGFSEFDNSDYFVLNISSGTNVLLNSFDVYQFPRTNILYNFLDAESIIFNSGNIDGHILAPNADFTFKAGLITGSVYANSFESGSGAQLNYEGGFLGAFTIEPPTGEQSEVHEANAPASFALILCAGFGLLLRRKLSTK